MELSGQKVPDRACLYSFQYPSMFISFFPWEIVPLKRPDLEMVPLILASFRNVPTTPQLPFAPELIWMLINTTPSWSVSIYRPGFGPLAQATVAKTKRLRAMI